MLKTQITDGDMPMASMYRKAGYHLSPFSTPLSPYDHFDLDELQYITTYESPDIMAVTAKSIRDMTDEEYWTWRRQPQPRGVSARTGLNFLDNTPVAPSMSDFERYKKERARFISGDLVSLDVVLSFVNIDDGPKYDSLVLDEEREVIVVAVHQHWFHWSRWAAWWRLVRRYCRNLGWTRNR